MDLNTLQHPFESICKDTISTGLDLYDALRNRMRPSWRSLPLEIEIEIVDDASLNASASRESDCYRIEINLGAVEHIFGAFYCLMCVPAFLPQIGDPKTETIPQSLNASKLMTLSVRSSESESWETFPCPNSPERQGLALMLATNALEFLLFHEVGHVVAGHLEILSACGLSACISEVGSDDQRQTLLRRACECDADIFATDVSTHAAVNPQMAELTHKLFTPQSWSENEASQILNLVTVGTLFRTMFPDEPRGISDFTGWYPHPAVRAATSCAYSNAIAMRNKIIDPATLNSLYIDSIVNIEDVWEELQLKKQITKDRAAWGMEIGSGLTFELMNCANHRAYFEEYAHVDRRWNCW